MEIKEIQLVTDIENMYDDGYINIDNNDICENIIKFMKERNINRKGLKCK